MKRIDPREVEGFDAAVAAAVAAAPRLVPWTTTVSGEPTYMWDDNDNLMMIEVTP
jgi:hypothetical protein